MDIGEIHLDVLGNTNWASMRGVFSFTLYYRRYIPQDNSSTEKLKEKNEATFAKSIYKCGILSYLNVAKHFGDVGILIFTDKESLSFVQTLLTSESERHLTIFVVHWPPYQVSDTQMEDTILRCMRFLPLALPELEGKWIAVRDADTLFVYDIMRIACMMNSLEQIVNGSMDASSYMIKDDKLQLGLQLSHMDTYRNNIPETLMNRLSIVLGKLIFDWENTFMELYANEIGGPQILIGVFPYYVPDWRKNYNPTNKAYYHSYPLSDRIFRGEFGTFAGFVTFFKNRPNHIWVHIQQYLTARYTIHTNRYTIGNVETIGKKYISNSCCDPIGKDERILMFCILPEFENECNFFEVNYFSLDRSLDHLENMLTSKIQIPHKSFLETMMWIKQTKNPKDVFVPIFDLLTPIEKSAFLPNKYETSVLKHVKKFYFDSYYHDPEFAYELNTYTLQPQYVYAAKSHTTIRFYYMKEEKPYNTIIHEHANAYKKWKTDYFPGAGGKRTRRSKYRSKKFTKKRYVR